MVKLNRKQIIKYILFVLVLCIARGLRELDIPNNIPIPTFLGLIQTLLYVGLITVWSVSARRRIVQPQIRAILECISGLMIFWHLTRGIKYHVVTWFVGQGWMMRYLWYLYYLPLLLIPAFLIVIAFTIRKPEAYRLPKKAIVALFSVSVVLFLCVITNDLHQLVFRFPTDAVVYTDAEYTHSILYFLSFAWIVGGSLMFFIETLKNCRLPNKKFLWLPIIPIVACVFYSTAYIFFNGIRSVWDFTTMFTFSLVSIFEIAIVVGLVPSNSRYAELFRAYDRSTLITDEQLSTVYSSKTAEPIDIKIMQKVISQGSVTEDGKRINCSHISGGYIFWKDDIAKLLEINEILEGTNEELRSYGSLLEEENKQKKRRQKIIEQRNMYESIHQKTKHQQSLLSDLSLKLQETDDKKQAEMLLRRIAVIGAYVKRRSNLCLLTSKEEKIPVSEVELCIKESITYLKLSGITSAIRLDIIGEIPCETAERLYDFFENAVELSLETLKQITVLAEEENNTITFNIVLNCNTDMSAIKASYPECDVEQDGNVWFCSLVTTGGVM